jgi:hypothetical protein
MTISTTDRMTHRVSRVVVDGPWVKMSLIGHLVVRLRGFPVCPVTGRKCAVLPDYSVMPGTAQQRSGFLQVGRVWYWIPACAGMTSEQESLRVLRVTRR